MRVIFVASDFIPHIGGKSSHILDLIDGLKNESVECDIISQKSIRKNRLFIIKLLLSPIRIISSLLYVYILNIIIGKEIKRILTCYLESNQADIISFQDAWAAYFGIKVLKKHNIPCVLTMHTYIAVEYTLDQKKKSWLTNYLYRKYYRKEVFALQNVNEVIVVDNRIYQHVLSIFTNYKNIKTKLTEIINFTNVDKFNIAIPSKRSRLRLYYNYNENMFIVICARRLVEKNGVINLVKAMELLKNHNDILALIAGDGPQRENIEEYIYQYNLQERVRLLGSLDTDQLIDYYKMADVSVVPSITVSNLQEATSITAIESMSCGLPTIASNIGGLKQLIKHYYNGLLVTEGDYCQIAESILLLKNNKMLYNSISKNARDYIEKNNSHIMAAKRYLEVFKKYL